MVDPHQESERCIVSGYLALLRRIKDCPPRQTRLTFYNCYILPHLDYCITIWGNASSVIRLYRLQKTVPMRDYHGLGIPSAQCTSDETAGLAATAGARSVPPGATGVQSRQRTGPRLDYICFVFRPVSEVSRRATRAIVRGNLCVPLGRACVSRNTVARAEAIIWNNLSAQVRRCQTLQAFKRAFIHYIMK